MRRCSYGMGVSQYAPFPRPNSLAAAPQGLAYDRGLQVVAKGKRS